MIKNTVNKIKKYHEEACERAQRRKSPWNFMLIPAVVLPSVIIWSCIFLLLNQMHALWFPGQSFYSDPQGVGPILTAVAPLFPSGTLGMLIGNRLLFSVPIIRRILDKEATGINGASYKNAQKTLLDISVILLPISLALAVYGASMPW